MCIRWCHHWSAGYFTLVGICPDALKSIVTFCLDQMRLWGMMSLKDTVLLRNGTCFYSPWFCSQASQGVTPHTAGVLELNEQIYFYPISTSHDAATSPLPRRFPLVHLVVKITLSVSCALCQSPISKTLIRLAVYYGSLIMCCFQNPDLQKAFFDHCCLPPLPHCVEAALSSSGPSCCSALPAAWGPAHHASAPLIFLLDTMGLVSATFFPRFWKKNFILFSTPLFLIAFLRYNSHTIPFAD